MSKIIFGDQLSQEALDLIETNIQNLRSPGGRMVIRELVAKLGEIVTVPELEKVAGMKSAAVCSTVNKARDRGFIIVNYSPSGVPARYQITGVYTVAKEGRTYKRVDDNNFNGLLNAVFC